LFAAVAHGCKAEKHQEVLVDVYLKRIKRQNEHYSTRKLGAYSSDLVAISNFFDVPWAKPSSYLSDEKKAMVLYWVGGRLRALGRLEESSYPLRIAADIYINQKNFKEAAKVINDLSIISMILGNVFQAISYAIQSVDFADQSGDSFIRQVMRAVLADTLHQASKVTDAERIFKEVEGMQKERRPQYPYLYSIRGFRYCDLLQSQGKYQDVINRSFKVIELAIRNKFILEIALDKLSLGRAFMLQAEVQVTNDFIQAEKYLNQAVEGLLKAGYQDFLVRGYLARAALYRLKNEFPKAWADLDEAYEIAERSEMKLYLTDYHLESCRLCIAEGKSGQAAQHLESAKKLIAETGYHRRDKEAEDLEKLVEKES